jgi:hypothetical protein
MGLDVSHNSPLNGDTVDHSEKVGRSGVPLNGRFFGHQELAPLDESSEENKLRTHAHSDAIRDADGLLQTRCISSKMTSRHPRQSGSRETPPQPVSALQIQAEPVNGDTRSGA